MVRNGLFLAVAAVIGIAVVGCSKTSLSGLSPVTGTITQGGKPLEGATVIFAPAAQSAARAAAGVTDANGVFTLTTLQPGDGAMPGDYNVTVSKVQVTGKVYTQEEGNKYYNEFRKPPPIPESKSLVAKKYTKAEDSGLKATVKKGDKNDFPFTVE